VTLELVNLGNIPMVLYVGMRVAQLSLFPASDGRHDESGEQEE
jgi:deoxycytidine triphosphate deaminase